MRNSSDNFPFYDISNFLNNVTLTAKGLAKLCFSFLNYGSTQWTCKCGFERIKKGSGYSNLTCHIHKQH